MAEEMEIDESLYSRQQIMLGEAAMKKMAKSSVLISGLGGLGVEIGNDSPCWWKETLSFPAKNVALAGVKALTLNDTQKTSWLDLSTNFYLSPNDIGKNRAQSCSKKINQLNPYVKFAATEEDIAKVDLSWFDQFTVRFFS